MKNEFYDRIKLDLSIFHENNLTELFVLLLVAKLSVYGISLSLVHLSGTQPSFNMYFNWDAGFFIRIAQQGYYSPASYAMAPLFPLFIRGFSQLLLGNFKISGLLVSNLFSFLEIIPAIMLFKHYSDRPSDHLKLWLFFPLYFVWGLVPYTEHVFSFFVLCSWWSLKSNRKILAIGLAALASLIRQPGVLLFIPLVLYFIFTEQSVKAKIRYTVASIIVPASTLLWNLIAGSLSGDPFVVVNAQQYFGSSFFTDLIMDLDLKLLIESYSTYTYPNHVAMPFLVSFIAFACFLLVPKIFKVDRYLAVYAFLNIGLFLVFLPLTSTLRYLAGLFPLFLVINPKIDFKLYVLVCILSSSLMLYAFMQTIFIG